MHRERRCSPARARLLLLALVLAACGNGGHGTLDAARTDPAVCKANLEAAIDRSCTMATDCVLVSSADCCGPIKLAVHTGTEASFPSLEQTYEACLACPPLGCAHQEQAEDGSTPQQGQVIAAACIAGRCTSVIQ